MTLKTPRTTLKQLVKHETKKTVFIKFIILVGILLAYTIYLSCEYGFATGGLLAIITWSFFVLCTPVADAGMLLDFPIRVLFRLRMWITELMVWSLAISVNVYALHASPDIYNKSFLGHVFHDILIHPVPYWSIIILSFLGTFLSVHFADELMDYVKHKDVQISTKHRLIFEGLIMIAIFLLIFFVYNILLEKLGIDASVFQN